MIVISARLEFSPESPAAFAQCGTKGPLVKDMGSRWNGVGYATVLLMLIAMVGCQALHPWREATLVQILFLLQRAFDLISG
jgi:hypothetical protein